MKRNLRTKSLTFSVKVKLSDSQKDFLHHLHKIRRARAEFPDLSFRLNGIVAQRVAFSADPNFGNQWHIPEIKLDQALDIVGQEQKDVTVAVIDSGSPSVNSVAWNDGGFISGGYDFNDFDNDPTDSDSTLGLSTETSYGVHVGSTIGALNNGVGINGFAVKVLPQGVQTKN